MDADHEIARLIGELRAGHEAGLDRLMPLTYEELRRIAHRQHRHQRAGHTLNTTAPVHGAYLLLVDQTCVFWGAASDRILAAGASRVGFAQPYRHIIPPAHEVRR